MTDPIADMLTRIRNGLQVRRESVDVPDSTMKRHVAEVLEKEGYIKGFKVFESSGKKTIRIFLKYGPEGENVINSIESVSTPGRRVYRGYRDVKPVLNGMGIQIISTPSGIMSDVECRRRRLGGEVLASIY
jgi:small subunit ribosomal protein S8